MAFLALKDDDIALLRFTCDLFFVDESPLYALDASQKEPADFSGTYHGLVQRGVIDPRGFRITDEHLNRIAPVTECDARIVHVVRTPQGAPTQTDFWLLDEIAVSYQHVEGHHLFGPDLDRDELIEHFARQLMPRRSGGDRVDLTLDAMGFLALSMVLERVRHLGTREIPIADLRQIFKRPPPDEHRLHGHMQARRRPVRGRATALLDDPEWEEALRSLTYHGGARVEGDVLWVHTGLVDLALREVGERHTIIRTDFGDDDWFVRETTFIPVEGSLFVIGPRRGGMVVEELNGDRLRQALIDAVGSPGRDGFDPQGTSRVEPQAGGAPVKAS